MNQLMHADRKEWNTELIRQMFHNFYAEEIIKIAIPRSDVKDHIAWHHERNGVFTVRSAYRLAASIQSHTSQSSSSSSGEPQDRSIWDMIWKANVPPKVRTFGWRIATNTLATKKNKYRRALDLDVITRKYTG